MPLLNRHEAARSYVTLAFLSLDVSQHFSNAASHLVTIALTYFFQSFALFFTPIALLIAAGSLLKRRVTGVLLV